MYIIVKDVVVGKGSIPALRITSKRVIVLNRASYAEAFRSKNRAMMALKQIVEDTNEKHEVINDEKYGGNAYSLFGGAEIFYVYELYVDNSL
tara:strand:- start:3739 stop:4014 length:276 start_codon:yes stop_codon:yes gene_type:complete